MFPRYDDAQAGRILEEVANRADVNNARVQPFHAWRGLVISNRARVFLSQ